jgi:hypothetical protein
MRELLPEKCASRLGLENSRKLIISQSFKYQTLAGQYGTEC